MNLHQPKAFLTKQIAKASNQNNTHRELVLKKLQTIALVKTSGDFLDTPDAAAEDDPKQTKKELPEEHQKWLAENEQAWKKLYKEAVHLHSRLSFVSEADRSESAFKILEIFEIIQLHWDAEKLFWEKGKTQTVFANLETPSELPEPKTIIEAFKMRNNYRSNITRNRQSGNLKKLAMYQKALAKVDDFINCFEK